MGYAKKKSGSKGEHPGKMAKSINSLIEYIQGIEDPVERQASTAYVIVSLVSEICNEVEGLGMLEKVKDFLRELRKPPTLSRCSSQPTYVF